jgi:hypothetical protein
MGTENSRKDKDGVVRGAYYVKYCTIILDQFGSPF